MGDAILFGVLRMPSELWGDGVIDKAQRESRYHEAADMIEQLRADLTAMTERAEKAEAAQDVAAALDVSGLVEALEIARRHLMILPSTDWFQRDNPDEAEKINDALAQHRELIHPPKGEE